LYRNVGVATCASLIAFTGIISVGGLLLLYRAVEGSRPAKIQISRSDTARLPELGRVGSDLPHAVTIEPPSLVDNAPKSLPREIERPATPSPEPVRQNDRTAHEQAMPLTPPDAETAHVEKLAVNTTARVAAGKKTAHRRVEKHRTNEALNSVRRFGDSLRDIPVNAYAADGTRRRIVIRPTSIQDVYYYSVPR
jgi:hypothetical protein